MAYFGNATGGASSVQAPPANDKAVSQFTLINDCTVSSVVIKYFTTIGGSKSKAIIYDSSGTGGKPGNLIAQSAEVVGAGSGGTTYTFSPAVSLTAAGGPYWVGMWSDSANTADCAALTAGIAFNANTYSTGGSPTNPFGSSPSTSNFQYPILIPYTPTLSPGTYSGELVGFTPGSFSTATYPANNLGMIQFTSSAQSGNSITSLTFFLSDNRASAKVKGVVYANDGTSGYPGTLLGVTPELVGPVAGGNTVIFGSAISLTGGQPYIGLFTDTALPTYFVVDTGRKNYDGGATYGTAPSTFPGGASSSNNQPALWANGTFTSGSGNGSKLPLLGIGQFLKLGIGWHLAKKIMENAEITRRRFFAGG